MDHSTPLHTLPEGIIFPSHVEERICFDAAGRRLSFRGFMTKCMYDELIALSGDVHYRRAIENLFVRSAEEFTPRAPRRVSPLLLAAAAAGFMLLATLISWAALRAALSRHEQGGDVHSASSVKNK